MSESAYLINLYEVIKKMKYQYKTLTLCKLCMWISLSLNALATCIFLYFQNANLMLNRFLLVSVVIILLQGIIRTNDEKSKGSFGIPFTIVDVLCISLISMLLLFVLYEFSCKLGMIIVSILMIVEAFVISIITYNHRKKPLKNNTEEK